MADLKGKVGIVTGGGTGIGLAIAEAFLAAGASIVITGRRSEVLQAACARLGPRAFWQQSDISEPQAQGALVAEVEDRVGALDILVNNAGRHLKKSAFEITDEEFSAVLRTNLDGLFALSREAARRMAGSESKKRSSCSVGMSWRESVKRRPVPPVRRRSDVRRR